MDGRVTDHYVGGCDYAAAGGGCGRRPRRPPPCLPPTLTDESGHYVGDHAGHPSRWRRSPDNPLATAAQCRDRLTRIVPVGGRCGYRDTTGQMSSFAHLR